MPTIDCPNCDGTGYTQDEAGATVICPMCDGTGTLFEKEDADYVESDDPAEGR